MHTELEQIFSAIFSALVEDLIERRTRKSIPGPSMSTYGFALLLRPTKCVVATTSHAGSICNQQIKPAHAILHPHSLINLQILGSSGPSTG